MSIGDCVCVRGEGEEVGRSSVFTTGSSEPQITRLECGWCWWGTTLLTLEIMCNPAGLTACKVGIQGRRM